MAVATNRLLLQFHITGNCNLNCKHCYRTEGNIERLSFEDIKNVIKQFKNLLKRYNKNNNIKQRGHINLTGGEPFFRKDIKEIIKLLGENQKYFSFAFLSNGSFITSEIIALLKENNVAFIQLSIDGNKKTHDYLRTQNDYIRVFKTAKLLEKNNIKVHISFTANKNNFKQFPTVARECYKHNLTKLWTDRLVPIGNGKEIEELSITKELLPQYIKVLKKVSSNPLHKLLHRHTEISTNRALQFINNSKAKIYSCSAGTSLITVDEFGQVMPCRRMPIICGDVFSSTLEEIYYTNKIFQELQLKLIPNECSNCKYSHICRGGAKCQSYATYGTYNKADPACFFIQEKGTV